MKGTLYIDGALLVNAGSISIKNNSDDINFTRNRVIEGTIQLDTTNFNNSVWNLMQSIRKLNKKLRKEQGKLKYLKRMRNRNKLYLKNKGW
ncbi:hypothetical protein ADU86_03895 [Clostridium botulinum]|uniref:hypothetical protein n=1 Tax=Clostridium botulinum TaxID=1491 RepID=UPI0006A4E49E|nr:hypothetical protein [Clostridium botulinum]KOC47749.1 hypothetical protein ADU86_03895 [Clostridium botulinum]